MISTAQADDLVELLDAPHPPVAVTVQIAGAPERLPAEEPPSEPAGCCFWRSAEDQALDTRPADHAGCSVGRYTHGLLGLEDVARASDTAALVGSGWVTPDELAASPRLPVRPTAIRYAPLHEADTSTRADVVLLRLTPAALTTLQGACPELLLTGKPQCQIVPLAYAGHAAVSPGCAVSRHRTGLPDGELTCALPGAELPRILTALRTSVAADDAVVAWAAQHDPTDHPTREFP